eukprot:scaffold306_cov241-Pinguiococcus_pyrenoidosus.AAC.7
MAAFLVGAFPLANLGLFLRTFYLDYDVHRITSAVVGAMVTTRSLGFRAQAAEGPLHGRLVLDNRCISTLRRGGPVRGRARYAQTGRQEPCSYGSAQADGWCFEGAKDAFLIFVAGGVGGAVLGALLAFLQGLPVVARTLLTSLRPGLSVGYRHIISCQCRSRCLHCTELHTHERLLNFVADDEIGLHTMLRGNPLPKEPGD